MAKEQRLPKVKKALAVPLNAVSLWLGHSNITTTLIYLRILPDPQGFMDRVP